MRAVQRCLTPPSALEGDCGFLAANLYARSVFGEDALVNVSVEQLPDGRLAGYIRIRCVSVCADPGWLAARVPRLGRRLGRWPPGAAQCRRPCDG